MTLQPAPEFINYFPGSFTLETSRVLLRPMTIGDLEAFTALSAPPEIWKFFVKDLSAPGELNLWMAEALAARGEGTRVPFTVVDKDSGEICGSTSYGNISFYDRRLEIGWSWLGTSFMGTGLNKPAKFALLSYAFEVMKMERVEVKTDVLNERAKAALLKVGMIPEGILRSHTQMHSGRRRDTLYFSLLRHEWPERKQAFFSELL